MSAAAAFGLGPYNLARECLGRRAEDPEFANRPAFSFVDGDLVERWTYGEAWAEVERVARGLLRQGLTSGDRVLIRLPHSPAYAFAFFGANLAGLVPVPASPQLTEAEARFLAADAECRAVIADEQLRLAGVSALHLSYEDIRNHDGRVSLPETGGEDPAYLIYTSGTTAQPKGVLHAQRVLRGRAPMLTDAWEGLTHSDVTMHAGTLNWSYTMGVGLMDPWVAGAHAFLVADGVEPASWPALIERHQVTVFVAVPTVYRQMLKYGRPEVLRRSALRHGLCAGEALPPAVADEWRSRTSTELYEALGMTECSTYISSGPAVPPRLGSPGMPQPGRCVRILPLEGGVETVPPGEGGLLAIHRSDPGLMLGYWRRPEEEASVFRGDWFVGGDLASMDADGYVWFQGRADDIIKSFGYRLSPVEVEAALSSCAGVAEVAVVGVRVEEDKTLVMACVVPQQGRELSEAALREHAEQHLATYKRPHQYRFVETLPRTTNGKLQRSALVDRLRVTR